jgi:hypothetical protein
MELEDKTSKMSRASTSQPKSKLPYIGAVVVILIILAIGYYFIVMQHSSSTVSATNTNITSKTVTSVNNTNSTENSSGLYISESSIASIIGTVQNYTTYTLNSYQGNQTMQNIKNTFPQIIGNITSGWTTFALHNKYGQKNFTEIQVIIMQSSKTQYLAGAMQEDIQSNPSGVNMTYNGSVNDMHYWYGTVGNAELVFIGHTNQYVAFIGILNYSGTSLSAINKTALANIISNRIG